MGVVSHGCGGLGVGMDVVGGRSVSMPDKASGVGRILADAGALPECEVKTLITRNHTALHGAPRMYERWLPTPVPMDAVCSM